MHWQVNKVARLRTSPLIPEHWPEGVTACEWYTQSTGGLLSTPGPFVPCPFGGDRLKESNCLQTFNREQSSIDDILNATMNGNHVVLQGAMLSYIRLVHQYAA